METQHSWQAANHGPWPMPVLLSPCGWYLHGKNHDWLAPIHTLQLATVLPVSASGRADSHFRTNPRASPHPLDDSADSDCIHQFVLTGRLVHCTATSHFIPILTHTTMAKNWNTVHGRQRHSYLTPTTKVSYSTKIIRLGHNHESVHMVRIFPCPPLSQGVIYRLSFPFVICKLAVLCNLIV